MRLHLTVLCLLLVASLGAVPGAADEHRARDCGPDRDCPAPRDGRGPPQDRRPEERPGERPDDRRCADPRDHHAWHERADASNMTRNETERRHQEWHRENGAHCAPPCAPHEQHRAWHERAQDANATANETQRRHQEWHREHGLHCGPPCAPHDQHRAWHERADNANMTQNDTQRRHHEWHREHGDHCHPPPCPHGREDARAGGRPGPGHDCRPCPPPADRDENGTADGATNRTGRQGPPCDARPMHERCDDNGTRDEDCARAKAALRAEERRCRAAHFDERAAMVLERRLDMIDRLRERVEGMDLNETQQDRILERIDALEQRTTERMDRLAAKAAARGCAAA